MVAATLLHRRQTRRRWDDEQRHWLLAGFEPDEAARWRRSDWVDPFEAARWRETCPGVHPLDLFDLRAEGYEPDQVARVGEHVGRHRLAWTRALAEPSLAG